MTDKKNKKIEDYPLGEFAPGEYEDLLRRDRLKDKTRESEVREMIKSLEHLDDDGPTTRNRARTRKEMFDALSPEEQEKALKEMTYPYPLMEAVDADVAREEMTRRSDDRGEFLETRFRREQEQRDDPQQKDLLEKVSRQDALRMLLELMEGESLMGLSERRPKSDSDDLEVVEEPSGRPGAVMSKAPSMKELLKMLKSIEDE